MISIYGENDGLSTILASEALLSTNAQIYQIDGGNHAQFGLYGAQTGDNEATITPLDQQDHIIRLLIMWLNDLKSRQ